LSWDDVEIVSTGDFRRQLEFVTMAVVRFAPTGTWNGGLGGMFKFGGKGGCRDSVATKFLQDCRSVGVISFQRSA
jgi:hypothetical protein